MGDRVTNLIELLGLDEKDHVLVPQTLALIETAREKAKTRDAIKVNGMPPSDKIKELEEISSSCNEAIFKAADIITKNGKLTPDNQGVKFFTKHMEQLQAVINDINGFIKINRRVDVMGNSPPTGRPPTGQAKSPEVNLVRPFVDKSHLNIQADADRFKKKKQDS